MIRKMTFAVASLVLLHGVATASETAKISGQYIEARTCDVWTGPCFANADYNLSGKNAVMAWKIDSGSFEGVNLDGLGMVAVISASDTLGLQQSGPSRSVVIVDEKATPSQRQALLRLAQKQSGHFLKNVQAVRYAPVAISVCDCKGGSCAEVKAGGALIKTRCIDADHDKACGNETAFYPPLSRNVRVRPAAAIETGFQGTGLRETWREFDRRGAYVGSFEIR